MASTGCFLLSLEKWKTGSHRSKQKPYLYDISFIHERCGIYRIKDLPGFYLLKLSCEHQPLAVNTKSLVAAQTGNLTSFYLFDYDSCFNFGLNIWAIKLTHSTSSSSSTASLQQTLPPFLESWNSQIFEKNGKFTHSKVHHRGCTTTIY